MYFGTARSPYWKEGFSLPEKINQNGETRFLSGFGDQYTNAEMGSYTLSAQRPF